MKRIFFLLAAFSFGITLLSAQNTRRYELKFGEFHELKVVDGINVDYISDPSRAGTVEFMADQTTASSVIFEPGKGKLSISLASRDTVYTKLPTVTVYSSFLSYVKNSGDSTVRVLSPAPVPKFKAQLVGNGRLVARDIKATEVEGAIYTGHGIMVLSGETTMAKLNIAGGASQIQADELKANEVSCTVTGTGTVNCYAVKKLSVGGLGSGKVIYRGTPEIKNKLVSKVKVVSLDSAQ